VTQDRPELTDLIDAAREHLETQVLRFIGDAELRSKMLLAIESMEEIITRLSEGVDQAEDDAVPGERSHTEPSELISVRTHISTELLPAISDPGLRYRTLVAANVLAIAARELAAAPAQRKAELGRLQTLLGDEALAQSLEALNQQLLQQVAGGAFDAGTERQALLEHLKQTASEKLEIANPKFLARLAAEDS
jgi:hypothetical protein